MPRSESVTADLATACVFSGGNFATSRPSSAPGTYRMCFDPFGRPQQIVGAKHSSLRTVDRKDGAVPYSDTIEADLTYCLNGTFANLQSADVLGGGHQRRTTTPKGRLRPVTTSVTEPTGDSTTYAYDVNGKLTYVTQGVQARTFGYDAAGFLRSRDDAGGRDRDLRLDRQPRQRPSGDAAGRPRPSRASSTSPDGHAQEDAGGSKYAVNCYDGAGACVDGSPNYVGGAYPGRQAHATLRLQLDPDGRAPSWTSSSSTATPAAGSRS